MDVHPADMPGNSRRDETLALCEPRIRFLAARALIEDLDDQSSLAFAYYAEWLMDEHELSPGFVPPARRDALHQQFLDYVRGRELAPWGEHMDRATAAILGE